MGGSVAVTMRRSNGEEFRMCRWTNTLPTFIQDVRWIQGDESQLDAYLKTWFDLREDFEKNSRGPMPSSSASEGTWEKWAKSFEYPMTPVYAPYPYLAPHDYGLVLIDYKTKTVLSMQGYSSLIQIFPYDLPSPTKDEEDTERLSQLLEHGSVCVVPRERRIDSEAMANARRVPDLQTLQEVIASVGEYEVSREFSFFVDPKPWTVHRFPETVEGIAQLKQAVLELGFALTDQEEEIWTAFPQERDFD